RPNLASSGSGRVASATGSPVVAPTWVQVPTAVVDGEVVPDEQVVGVVAGDRAGDGLLGDRGGEHPFTGPLDPHIGIHPRAEGGLVVAGRGAGAVRGDGLQRVQPVRGHVLALDAAQVVRLGGGEGLEAGGVLLAEIGGDVVEGDVEAGDPELPQLVELRDGGV